MTNRAGRKWGRRQKAEESLSVQLTGDAELLERLKRFLSLLEWTGSIGHSAYYGLFCDGDGADRLQVSGFETDPYKAVAGNLSSAELVIAGADAARPARIEFPSAEKSAPLTVHKQADGRYRWVLISSNAFQDRDDEVVSQKALDADVARADVDGDYGPLLWWHMPAVELGVSDWNAMHGRMLVESGLFHQAEVAAAVKEHADELGVSIGFYHPESEPDADGVFHSIRRFERSLLPRAVASNPLTAVPIVEKENRMDADKLKAFAKVMGGDEALVAHVLSYSAEAEKSADVRGVRHKEAGDPPAPVAELSACVKAKMEAGATEAEARRLCEEESAAPVAEGQTDKAAQIFMGDMTPAQFDAHLMRSFKSFGDSLRTEVKAMLTEQATTKSAADAESRETLKGYETKLDVVAQAVQAALNGVAELQGELPRALGERQKGWRASRDGEQPTTEQKKEAMPVVDPADPWAAHFAGIVGVNGQQSG